MMVYYYQFLEKKKKKPLNLKQYLPGGASRGMYYHDEHSVGRG